MVKGVQAPRKRKSTALAIPTYDSQPGPAELAVSAHLSSKSPAVEGYIPASFPQEKAALESFFPNGAVVAHKYKINGQMKDALGNEALSENEFRWAICQQLLAKDVKLAPSADMNSGNYVEAEISTLLHDWCNKPKVRKEFEKVDRILHGLMGTTASKPDLTVYSRKMIIFGEVKNHENYTTKTALAQCSLYLVALLYFIRVQMGVPVKSVFGFYVCGCKCKSFRNKYVVGLVKLSAPEELGASIVAHHYFSYYETNDISGIRLLLNFLNFGITHEPYVRGHLGGRVTHLKTPALLVLPVGLWDDPRLIANGTLSIVFRGTQSDIHEILGFFLKEDRIWMQFKTSVFQFLPPTDTTYFYIKVRTKDSSLRSNPASPLQLNFHKLKTRYNQMYCDVTPYGTEDMGVFFMKDCGQKINPIFLRTITFSQLCEKYKTFYDEVIELCDAIFHGDVLPHNIVITDDDAFMLVDLDEGTYKTEATRRIIIEDANVEFLFLRYPNFLREWDHRQLYTQVQLLSSFLYLAKFVTYDEENNARKTKVEQSRKDLVTLMKMADDVNSYLSTNNKKSSFAEEASFADKKMITDTIDAMELLLVSFK